MIESALIENPMKPEKAREWREFDEATAGEASDVFAPQFRGLVVSIPTAFWRQITITPQQEDKSSG